MNNKTTATTFNKLNSSKTTKTFMVFIILLIGLSSCSITKCRYSNGFKMDLHIAQKEKAIEQKAKMAEKRQAQSYKKDTAMVKPVVLAEMDFVKKSNKQIKNKRLEIFKNKVSNKFNLNNTNLLAKNINNEKTNIINFENKKSNLVANKLKIQSDFENDFWKSDFGYTIYCILEFLMVMVFGALVVIIVIWVATLPLPLQYLIGFLFGLLGLYILFNDFISGGIDFLNTNYN